MPVINYVMGAATVVAGLLFMFNGPAPESGDSSLSSPSWWGRMNQWIFHSHPSRPYANLPLFGITPDILIRPRHSLRGAGFHRRYRLEVELISQTTVGNQLLLDSPKTQTCQLLMEWRFDQNFLIDQWLLHKSGPGQWIAPLPPVDLEAPAYSSKAQPFILQAKVPLSTFDTDKRVILLEIPDIVPRYQLPNTYPSIIINSPQITFQCPTLGNQVIAQVEKGDIHFKPFSIQVPTAISSPWYQPVTFSTIVLCLFYILYHIYKA